MLVKIPYNEGVVVVEFQGQKFGAGGAYANEERSVGYPEFPRGEDGRLREFIGQRGVIKSCSGEVLGSCVITGRWPTPRSWVSSHRVQVEAKIGGIFYTGRGYGHGMVWFGKRKAKQNWS